MSTKPRVLLVEDDAPIRSLVALALEDEPIELLACESVTEALGVLAVGPVQLLITDLMMPGQSGFDLLAVLQDRPQLRGCARLAVFSAGVGQEGQVRLQALGVERVFTKPMSLADFVAGVKDMLASPQGGQTVRQGLSEADPFAGDEALRGAFTESCLLQWPQDLREGDRACAASDTGHLRRVAHNLKGSLRLLRAHAEAEMALQLERACAEATWPPDGQARWEGLSAALKVLAERLPPLR
ncbi:MAG: response regulator [Burkholderiales bacterium]|nr:response regulator [Burkholderiales bacterium]